MTGVVRVQPGAAVHLEDGEYIVIRWRTAEHILVESRASGARKVVPLTDLKSPPTEDLHRELVVNEITDPRWEEAKLKYDTVQEVLRNGGGEAKVKEAAESIGVHPATVYRWISDYRKTKLITELYRKERSDKGKLRLHVRVEALIRRVILNYYLTDERRTIKKAHDEVERLCRLRKLTPPSLDTFKSRLGLCPTYEAAVARGDTKLANRLRLNQGRITGADFPYALVQIDHTRVDLFLVDKEHRIAIGRPWLTVAIDVFSRMCVGFYVSFDPPGMLGTGLCLTHAILNKQKWMSLLGVDYDYPCQGIPKIVHADNAREFRGNSLQLVCGLHGMDLRFRKLKKPQHGAHIERLMGTLMTEIHALPGTTFSNVDDKGDYDSEGKAVFTLEKFERWLAHLILGRYHHQPHDGLGGVPPIVKFKKALTGEDGGLPVGELSVETNEEQLYYDFLPTFSMTVQPYGLQLDLIKYRSEVLSRWVGSRDPGAPTKARKFVVKRDPRAIGALFFFDPEIKRYYRIPYFNLSNPDISVWELRRVRAYLRAKNQEDVDEETIFNAYNEMRALEMQEEEATKKVRRHSAAKKARSRRDESPQPKFGHAAEGRPEVFATEPGHTSDPASTRVEVSQSTSDDAAVSSPSEPPDAERASQISPPPPRKVHRPPPKPFDEIEEY